jgi:hypothetical protein
MGHQSDAGNQAFIITDYSPNYCSGQTSPHPDKYLLSGDPGKCSKKASLTVHTPANTVQVSVFPVPQD